MKIPENPPPLPTLLGRLTSGRIERVLAPPLRPEVEGEYVHWEDLRRRRPPPELELGEWWLRLAISRSALQLELPLMDKAGGRLRFCRTDSLERLLHGVDRDLGNQLEASDPRIATPETRDRYIIRSLAEEAITSSQLEGASATRKVAKEMLLSGRAPRSRDEQMIANNFRAMELVRSRQKEALTRELILELHEVLTAGTLDERGEEGRFRRGDETVAVTDLGDGQILHVPPEAGQLEERIAALCAFANADGDDAFIHPVVRSIALHFMLAYDHPFVDGNGRTARALFYWSMLRHNYWLAEFLSISRVIQKAPSRYGRAFLLSETDFGDVTYFLLHQLHVLRTAIDELHVYLKRKAKEVQEAERRMRSTLDLNQRQQLLIAHALRHPGARYTIDGYRREYGVVYATARADLLGLVELKLLEFSKVGRRHWFTVRPDLSTLLPA